MVRAPPGRCVHITSHWSTELPGGSPCQNIWQISDLPNDDILGTMHHCNVPYSMVSHYTSMYAAKTAGISVTNATEFRGESRVDRVV
jgi:hypothetical protein